MRVVVLSGLLQESDRARVGRTFRLHWWAIITDLMSIVYTFDPEHPGRISPPGRERDQRGRPKVDPSDDVVILRLAHLWWLVTNRNPRPGMNAHNKKDTGPFARWMVQALRLLDPGHPLAKSVGMAPVKEALRRIRSVRSPAFTGDPTANISGLFRDKHDLHHSVGPFMANDELHDWDGVVRTEPSSSDDDPWTDP